MLKAGGVRRVLFRVLVGLVGGDFRGDVFRDPFSKGYMQYERSALESIAQARSTYAKAVTVNQKADASGPLASSARQLFATAENYPELKANDTFLQLQKRITELEEQIADRREFYNDSVNTFNIRMREMPDAFVARRMRLQPRQMFKAKETEQAPARVLWDEVMR